MNWHIHYEHAHDRLWIWPSDDRAAGRWAVSHADLGQLRRHALRADPASTLDLSADAEPFRSRIFDTQD